MYSNVDHVVHIHNVILLQPEKPKTGCLNTKICESIKKWFDQTLHYISWIGFSGFPGTRYCRTLYFSLYPCIRPAGIGWVIAGSGENIIDSDLIAIQPRNVQLKRCVCVCAAIRVQINSHRLYMLNQSITIVMQSKPGRHAAHQCDVDRANQMRLLGAA